MPCKCGSTAFGNMLFILDNDGKNHWEELNTSQDTRLAKDVLISNGITDYECVGIARDPVEWYVSGFRFIQQQIDLDENVKLQDGYWQFPKTFQEHLELIHHYHNIGLDNTEKDEWWVDHCFLNPYMHFTENTIVFDLKDWHTIKLWFRSFYKLKHDFFIVNKTSDKIPYPILDYNHIFLIKKLYSDFWTHPNIYNIDKSIKNYITKR